jgi:hypothetical protein
MYLDNGITNMEDSTNSNENNGKTPRKTIYQAKWPEVDKVSLRLHAYVMFNREGIKPTWNDFST